MARNKHLSFTFALSCQFSVIRLLLHGYHRGLRQQQRRPEPQTLLRLDLERQSRHRARVNPKIRPEAEISPGRDTFLVG